MSGKNEDYSLKETKPKIGADRVSGDENLTSSFDLVEQMEFLYVQIVKAIDLPLRSVNGIIDPYVEIKIGNYNATTKYFEKNQNFEWNQVFAFARDRLQDIAMLITVRDKGVINNDNMIGKITVKFADVPTCVPPDSPLAAKLCRLEDKNGKFLRKGALMLAYWFGTQADRMFHYAWHSDSAIVSGESLLNTCSNVYILPTLWYLRVNIIQAQDLILPDNDRDPGLYVKAVVGDVRLRTRVSPDKNRNPKWNEELMFVVAKPLRDPLIVITVEDSLGNNMIRHLGKCIIRPSDLDNRWLPVPAGPIWKNLEHNVSEDGVRKEMNFYSKLNLKASLDGGYNVLDESIHLRSDSRPSEKQLWTSMIGVLELGIINATGLKPMKIRQGRETTDAYCVAKYGSKWIRTRTVVDKFDPRWNEQYTWDVYEPFTVLSIGVFDDCHLHGNDLIGDGKDPSLGKVRIRISTLAKNKIYTHSYPLVVLQPNGVRKMGEIQLAIRFTCSSSYWNLFKAYTMNPLLPKMHHIFPLSTFQLDVLRKQAVAVICSSLSRTEPPLRKEVVEYMLDGGSQTWSLRKAKANFFRIMPILNDFWDALKWFNEIRKWKNKMASGIVLFIYLFIVWNPDCMFPTVTVCAICVLIFQYWRKPSRQPTHFDVELSVPGGSVTADELDEELDTFPSSRQSDVLRMRYDRLRSIAERFVTVIGDIAIQFERFQSLLNGRDPRIAPIFLLFCLVGFLILYYISSLKFSLIVGGLYVLMGQLLGNDVLNAPQNFFSRLPTKDDMYLEN